MKAKLGWTLVGILLALPIGLASAEDADHGKDHDKICRFLKLLAVSEYYGCLLRVDDDEAKQPRCDDRFERQFERADRISPRCEPLDDLDRTQTSVRSQAHNVLAGDVSQPPCASITGSGNRVTCWLNQPGENTAVSSVNLQDLLAQLQSDSECAPCAQITAQTVLWLQAWGADGGTGKAGIGGYAQTVTSIQSLEDDFGALDLYYYLAQAGTHSGASGGQGGAATIVTAQDLTTNPTAEPDQSMIILIAGGGGGGGGDDTACIVGTDSPDTGGEGGIAISTTGPDGEGIGQGTNGGGGGKGGGQGVGGLGQGGGSEDGMAGIGGRGGAGGEGAGDKVSGNPGWVNTGSITLTLTDGQGGVGGGDSSSCTAGGGAGGGGWGGGGGGSHGNTDSHPGAGGGGGSFSIPSTSSDGEAPTTRPSNPGSSAGFVQLVFNLDPS